MTWIAFLFIVRDTNGLKNTEYLQTAYFYFHRKSMEMRDSKNQEGADWLRMYQMKSQAMKKTVTLHAKLLDPHSSLKEVHTEKLQYLR